MATSPDVSSESGRLRLGHYLITATAITLMAVAWLFFGQVSRPPEERSTVPVARVVVAAAELRDFDLAVSVVGRVRPWRQVEVAAEVSGRVEDVRVQVGDRVGEGALLLRIDPDTYADTLEERRAALLRTRARLKESTASLQRMTRLRDRGAISAQEFDAAVAQQRSAEADVQAAEAAVARARRQLEDTEVVAPFAGTIVERDVDPGALVGADRPVLTLADLTTVAIEAGLTEQEVLRVRDADEAYVTSSSMPGRQAQGTIDGIAESADPATGTYHLRVEVDNRETPGFLGGMVVQVRLPWAHLEGALAVPAAALVEGEGEPHVFVIQDDVARRVPVQVLARQAEWVAVATPAGREAAPGAGAPATPQRPVGDESAIEEGREASRVPSSGGSPRAPGDNGDEGDVADDRPHIAPGSRVVVVGQSLLSDGEAVEVVSQR